MHNGCSDTIFVPIASDCFYPLYTFALFAIEAQTNTQSCQRVEAAAI